MKKAIKKIFVAILTIMACLSLILMMAERPDGSISLTWSLAWMAVFAISAKTLDRMGIFKEEESE